MVAVTVRGVEINYELLNHSSGPRLLVFAGSNGDLRVDNPGRPLADRFTVLTPDHRGMGLSSAPPAPWSVGDYADDHAGLLDALGWDRCHVMGISFGGMVAQEFAIRFPDRVDRLVLACTSSGGAGGHSAPIHEHARLPLDERTAVRMETLDRRHDRAWQAAHPDEVAAFRARLAAADERDDATRAAVVLQYEARAAHDTFDRLPSIAAPTLVAAGRYDGQAPPENQEPLVQRIPDARLAFFEGGHGFLREDPAAYEAVAAFLHGVS
jgi:3-oxoadipate enol-lactonase